MRKKPRKARDNLQAPFCEQTTQEKSHREAQQRSLRGRSFHATLPGGNRRRDRALAKASTNHETPSKGSFTSSQSQETRAEPQRERTNTRDPCRGFGQVKTRSRGATASAIDLTQAWFTQLPAQRQLTHKQPNTIDKTARDAGSLRQGRSRVAQGQMAHSPSHCQPFLLNGMAFSIYQTATCIVAKIGGHNLTCSTHHLQCWGCSFLELRGDGQERFKSSQTSSKQICKSFVQWQARRGGNLAFISRLFSLDFSLRVTSFSSMWSFHFPSVFCFPARPCIFLLCLSFLFNSFPSPCVSLDVTSHRLFRIERGWGGNAHSLRCFTPQLFWTCNPSFAFLRCTFLVSLVS